MSELAVTSIPPAHSTEIHVSPANGATEAPAKAVANGSSLINGEGTGKTRAVSVPQRYYPQINGAADRGRLFESTNSRYYQGGARNNDPPLREGGFSFSTSNQQPNFYQQQQLQQQQFQNWSSRPLPFQQRRQSVQSEQQSFSGFPADSYSATRYKRESHTSNFFDSTRNDGGWERERFKAPSPWSLVKNKLSTRSGLQTAGSLPVTVAEAATAQFKMHPGEPASNNAKIAEDASIGKSGDDNSTRNIHYNQLPTARKSSIVSSIFEQQHQQQQQRRVSRDHTEEALTNFIRRGSGQQQLSGNPTLAAMKRDDEPAASAATAAVLDAKRFALADLSRSKKSPATDHPTPPATIRTESVLVDYKAGNQNSRPSEVSSSRRDSENSDNIDVQCALPHRFSFSASVQRNIAQSSDSYNRPQSSGDNCNLSETPGKSDNYNRPDSAVKFDSYCRPPPDLSAEPFDNYRRPDSSVKTIPSAEIKPTATEDQTVGKQPIKSAESIITERKQAYSSEQVGELLSSTSSDTVNGKFELDKKSSDDRSSLRSAEQAMNGHLTKSKLPRPLAHPIKVNINDSQLEIKSVNGRESLVINCTPSSVNSDGDVGRQLAASDVNGIPISTENEINGIKFINIENNSGRGNNEKTKSKTKVSFRQPPFTTNDDKEVQERKGNRTAPVSSKQNHVAPDSSTNIKKESKITSNGDLKSPLKIPNLKKEPSSLRTPTKSLSPKSPESCTGSIGGQERKKVPMNKIQVGAAPSPNLKVVRSKIGSLENSNYKPGGGKIKIENKKLSWNAQPRIEAKNQTYIPGGGDKKIEHKKLQWNAKSKIGSLDNSTHRPGGGEKKIESVKLDFKEKAKPKIGSKDNIKHIPGGGTVKTSVEADQKSTSSDIEEQKLEIKAQSKIGSLDNVKHKPGGGEKKIFDDKTYLKQGGKEEAKLDNGESVSNSPKVTKKEDGIKPKTSSVDRVVKEEVSNNEKIIEKDKTKVNGRTSDENTNKIADKTTAVTKVTATKAELEKPNSNNVMGEKTQHEVDYAKKEIKQEEKKTDITSGIKKVDTANDTKKIDTANNVKKVDATNDIKQVDPIINSAKKVETNNDPKKIDTANSVKKVDATNDIKQVDPIINSAKKVETNNDPKKIDIANSVKKVDATNDIKQVDPIINNAKKVETNNDIKKIDTADGPKKIDTADDTKKIDTADDTKKVDTADYAKKVNQSEKNQPEDKSSDSKDKTKNETAKLDDATSLDVKKVPDTSIIIKTETSEKAKTDAVTVESNKQGTSNSSRKGEKTQIDTVPVEAKKTVDEPVKTEINEKTTIAGKDEKNGKVVANVAGKTNEQSKTDIIDIKKPEKKETQQSVETKSLLHQAEGTLKDQVTNDEMKPKTSVTDSVQKFPSNTSVDNQFDRTDVTAEVKEKCVEKIADKQTAGKEISPALVRNEEKYGNDAEHDRQKDSVKAATEPKTVKEQNGSAQQKCEQMNGGPLTKVPFDNGDDRKNNVPLPGSVPFQQ